MIDIAVTSMWAIKTRLDHVVDYVMNDLKTIEQVIEYTTNGQKTNHNQYVTCLNCNCFEPYNAMILTKKSFHDDSDILAFHGYQSFKHGEVTAEIAHEIGVQLAQRLWSNRFEVIVSTHLDKEHYHNHFLVNSTSFVDGKRFYYLKKDLYELRETSDLLCKEYGLSIIDQPKGQGKRRQTYQAKMSYIKDIKRDIDDSIKCSLTMVQFKDYMNLKGYLFEMIDDELCLLHPYYHHPISIVELGTLYSMDSIKKRILEIDYRTVQPSHFNLKKYENQYKKNQLNGLQKLYIHYLYLLGILPTGKVQKQKLSQEMRKELRKLDRIVKEIELLCKNKIENTDQLLEYKQCKQEDLDQLIKQRNQCYNQMRRSKSETEKKKWSETAKTFTPNIKSIRYEIKCCDEIFDRSQCIKEQINLLEIQEKKRSKRDGKMRIY